MKKNSWVKRNWILMVISIPLIFLLSQKVYELIILWSYQLEILRIPVQVDSPVEATNKLNILTPFLVQEIEEISILDSQDNTANIITLSESPSRDFLQVVYSNGLLIRWDISSKSISSQMNIGATSRRGTNFNKDGSWIVTPGRDGMKGHQIFNVETGKVVDCNDAQDCSKNINFTYSGQILSPNAKLLLQYGYDFYFRPELEWDDQLDYKPSALSNDCLFRDGFDDFHSSLDIRLTTISPSQQYIAYILEGGETCVREMKEITGVDMKTGMEIQSASEAHSPFDRLRFDLPGVNVYPRALEFDPTNRWLAALTTNELIIWSLNKFFYPEKAYVPMSNGNVLSFDRTGDLLALGTTNKLILLNAVEGKQIAEFETPEITAIYFTRDNRMLVWGDAEGNVHLWGVPQK